MSVKPSMFYGHGRTEADLRAEERAYQEAGYDWPPSGKLATCDVCGKQEVWGPPWSIYGSIRDIEGKIRGYKYLAPPQPEKMVTCCSDDCREQARAAPIPGKHVIPEDVKWIK